MRFASMIIFLTDFGISSIYLYFSGRFRCGLYSLSDLDVECELCGVVFLNSNAALL